MRKDFLIFGAPKIGAEEIKEVVAVLESGWIGTGPRVAIFESDFAAYKNVPFACAVNSCTAALHLSVLSANIGVGDEVITTPLTFCATINAIIHSGATPVLADVDPQTLNIDPIAVEAAITKRTRAVIPVHFAGRSCDMDSLLAITRQHNLLIIEDCAHAVETEYKGRKAGTIGDFGCFSFYATKNVVTGEGGMVLCKDEKQSCRIKQLALHGMSCDAWKRYSDTGFKHYFVVEPGFKYNMTDIQAALGIHQLARVEDNHRRRSEIWECYNEAFADLPLTLPAEEKPDSRHAYHLYTVQINDDAPIRRDEFLEAMTKMRIGVGVHYLSVAEHPYYQSALLWRPEMCPHAMEVGRRTVSLPLSAKLTEQDVEDVIKAVRHNLMRQ